MSSEHQAYFKDLHINFRNRSDIPEPLKNFNDNRLRPEIRDVIKKAGFTQPTPIQSAAIPYLLKKVDLIGISQTGSGKTLCYLIPAIEYLIENGPDERSTPDYACPRILVVLPTRELAMQIMDEVEKFNVSCVCLYGGEFKSRQLQMLARCPDIVVGTPGRINDIIENGRLSCEQVEYLVLDEGDRMLDMGFYPQISKIVNLCPKVEDRHTLMFSATWARKVQDLANGLLRRDYVFISIGSPEIQANLNIKQHLIEAFDEQTKRNIIMQIIKDYNNKKMLIFTNTKTKASELGQLIYDKTGQTVGCLHGDVPQEIRTRVFRDFIHGRIFLIIATDVASRGLDIPNIEVVVNYDFPHTDIDSYVHRIGRCGRADKKGEAFSFVNHELLNNYYMHKRLLKIVKTGGNEVPPSLDLPDSTSGNDHYEDY